jgi:hypothetical protein
MDSQGGVRRAELCESDFPLHVIGGAVCALAYGRGSWHLRDRGRAVAYVTSFSKIIMLALRLGLARAAGAPPGRAPHQAVQRHSFGSDRVGAGGHAEFRQAACTHRRATADMPVPHSTSHRPAGTVPVVPGTAHLPPDIADSQATTNAIGCRPKRSRRNAPAGGARLQSRAAALHHLAGHHHRRCLRDPGGRPGPQDPRRPQARRLQGGSAMREEASCGSGACLTADRRPTPRSP